MSTCGGKQFEFVNFKTGGFMFPAASNKGGISDKRKKK